MHSLSIKDQNIPKLKEIFGKDIIITFNSSLMTLHQITINIMRFFAGYTPYCALVYISIND
jgi:hypothetical protein